MVTALTGCRVDLAGGTLDIWPLGLLHQGARTVNVAIDLPVEVRISKRETGYRIEQGAGAVEADSVAELMANPDGALVGQVVQALTLPPVSIRLFSGSPRGGGLGASSALMVTLIAAGESFLDRSASSPGERARLARDLEARLMGLPTGVQDHYPPMLGGALEILYQPGGEVVRRLDTDLERLGAALLVVYSGQSHFSAGANWSVVRRRLEADHPVPELLQGISEAARDSADCLESNDLVQLGSVMTREWKLRRQLSDQISTPKVEALLMAAAEAGAWGGKACGAGGGGSLAILCPPEKKQDIAARLEALGGEILQTAPTAAPLQVTSEE